MNSRGSCSARLRVCCAYIRVPVYMFTSVRVIVTTVSETTVATVSEKLVSPVPLSIPLANSAEKTVTGDNV